MKGFFITLLIALTYSATLQGQNQDTINLFDQQGARTGYWEQYNPETKQLSYQGFFLDGHPIGRFLRFHSGGGIKAEMYYDSTGIDVQTRFYDSTGILRAEGLYHNQIKQGEWIYYSSRDIPSYTVTYNIGQLHGKAARFDINGHPIEKTNWVNGRLNGKQFTYNSSGEIVSSISYSSGSMEGEYLLFHDNQTVQVNGQYLNNLMNGPWTYYDVNGNTLYILHYERGHLQNPEILNQRNQDMFKKFEQNRHLLKDPEDYTRDPELYLIKDPR